MALPEFSMRQLLEAGVHYGHQTQRWNPRMAEFIYGERNGIHILDLTQTVPLLDRALQVIRDTVAKGGRVLGGRVAILKHIGNALSVRHRVAGPVEVSEKPDILWDKPQLERLYARLEDEYELKERAESLNRKLAVVAETAQVLNSSALRASDADNARLFGVLLDLVALSLSRSSRTGVAESAGLAEATWLALRRAVDRRLREPGLGVATIAAAIGISERYVHKLFERAGTTFASYMMDRRLDGAARDLKDPAIAGRAIGDVAFDWGFSDLSHFTRRFKHRFGCTPRDWRRG